MNESLRAWLREPLLHFVAVGLVLFIASELRQENPDTSRIVITAQREAQLAARHALQFGSPPSEGTLRRLVEQDIEEEILFRRGVALGLDRDDEIVRRRVVQKMQFLLHDVQGLEHREVAEALGIAEGTSKSQVHKARLRLRALLGGTRRR